MDCVNIVSSGPVTNVPPVVNAQQDIPGADTHSSESKSSKAILPGTPVVASITMAVTEKPLKHKVLQDRQAEAEVKVDQKSSVADKYIIVAGRYVVNKQRCATDHLAEFAMEASGNIRELEALKAEFAALSDKQKGDISILTQKFQQKLLVVRDWIDIWNVRLKALLGQLGREEMDNEHKESLLILSEKVFLEVKNLYIPLCLDLTNLGMSGNENMQLFLNTCEEFHEICLIYQDGLRDLLEDLANEITDGKYSWNEKIELIRKIQRGIAALRYDSFCDTRDYGLPQSSHSILEKYRYAFQAEMAIFKKLDCFWVQLSQKNDLETFGMTPRKPDDLLIWDKEWINRKMCTEISPLLGKLLDIRDDIPGVLAKCLEICRNMLVPKAAC